MTVRTDFVNSTHTCSTSFLQIIQNNVSHFCQCSMSTKIPPWNKKSEHFTINYIWLLGLHCHHHPGLSCDLSRTQIGGSLRGLPTPDFMVGAEALPTYSLQLFLMSGVRCSHVSPSWRIIVSFIRKFSLSAYCSFLSESSKTWWFLLWAKNQPVCTPQHQSQFP